MMPGGAGAIEHGEIIRPTCCGKRRLPSRTERRRNVRGPSHLRLQYAWHPEPFSLICGQRNTQHRGLVAEDEAEIRGISVLGAQEFEVPVLIHSLFDS
jgi:hypothetical protein